MEPSTVLTPTQPAPIASAQDFWDSGQALHVSLQHHMPTWGCPKPCSRASRQCCRTCRSSNFTGLVVLDEANHWVNGALKPDPQPSPAQNLKARGKFWLEAPSCLTLAPSKLACWLPAEPCNPLIASLPHRHSSTRRSQHGTHTPAHEAPSLAAYDQQPVDAWGVPCLRPAREQHQSSTCKARVRAGIQCTCGLDDIASSWTQR